MTIVGAPARVAEAETLGATVQAVAGPLDAAAQAQFWLGQTRSAPEVIWLEWAALRPPDLAAIRQYRILRSAVRIIVEIPAELTPPDPHLAALVSWGIYDLVTEQEALAAVVRHPRAYGDAARWHGPVALPPEEARGDRVRPEDRPALHLVRRRVWLLVGASGGSGVTTLTAALALTWAHRLPVTVGVLDASPSGGFVGLPLGADLVEAGWESGQPLTAVAGTWRRRHWLVPQGLAFGRRGGLPDVVPLVAEARRAPVDLWLVDGGLDASLLGRGAAWWDGILAVVRADWPGWHAAQRWAPLWREQPAFAGVVLMQHRPGPVHPADWAAAWHVRVLAVIPPAPDALEAFWRDGRVPTAWVPIVDRLSQEMLT